MRTIIVTGSAGLIGSETVRRFSLEGMNVVGIDNDMRARFFGAEASTKKTRDDLVANVRGYEHHEFDIRDGNSVNELFKQHGGHIVAVVHTASQPSHDWAQKRPLFLSRRTRSMATGQTISHCASCRSGGKSKPATSTSLAFPNR